MVWGERTALVTGAAGLLGCSLIRALGRPDRASRLGAGTPGEISIKRGSTARTRQVLGREPAVSLGEGLARTVAWHRGRSRVLLESGT